MFSNITDEKTSFTKELKTEKEQKTHTESNVYTFKALNRFT